MTIRSWDELMAEVSRDTESDHVQNLRARLTETITSVTDLWDEPLDEVHDVRPIVTAILASYFANPWG